MEQRLRVHSASDNDTGPNRSADRTTAEGGHLLVVCRGIAGPDRGERASELALGAIIEVMNGTEDGATRVVRALEKADEAIREAGGEPMGCSALVAYVHGDHCWAAWCGDCDAYLIRDRTIVQRSTPHPPGTVLGSAGDAPPLITHTDLPWRLVQSDKIIILSQEISVCVEDKLLPSVVMHRPPEEAVVSVMKLAKARGAGPEGVLLIGSWQDPSLETVSEEDWRPKLDADEEDTTQTDEPSLIREAGPDYDVETGPIARPTKPVISDAPAPDRPAAPASPSKSPAFPLIAAGVIGVLLLVVVGALVMLAS